MYERADAMRRTAVVVVAAVFLMVSAACTGTVEEPARIEQTKYEQLQRAGRELRENVNQGVTLMVYRELVGKYATEVSLAADKAESEMERGFVAQHQKALEAFRAVLTLWNKQLKDNSKTVRVADGPEFKKIADDYSFMGTGTGDGFTFEIDTARQAIWTQAGNALDSADRTYRGQDADSLPIPDR
jgi:hypothetical protein